MASRDGQAQLALWISSAAMETLKAHAQQSGLTLRAAVEQAIEGWRPAPDLKTELQALGDRVAKLEVHIPKWPQGVDGVREVIQSLADQGLGPQAIANNLAEQGITTADGGPIHRGDMRIRRAVAKAKEGVAATC